MSKLNLTPEEARDIVYGFDPDFSVEQDTICDNSRWSIFHEVVVRRLADNKYFMGTYQVGATECQEERAFENTDPDFVEAIPVQRTITEYVLLEES